MSERNYGLAWSDKFKIGNDIVDGQHQRLFEMLNELVSFCEDGSETEKLQRTLDNLVDYTVRHFHDEESLQIEYNYPEYQNHKKMHDDFKSEVGRLLDAFQKSGSSAALSKDVNRIMVRWIIFHVQNEDRKIGAYIKKVNSRR